MDPSNLALTKPHFKSSVFKGFIATLEKEYPSVDINEIANSTGLDLDYFKDENNWISAEVQWKFVQECLKATSDKSLSYKAGLRSLHPEILGSVTHYFLRHLVPLSEIFDRLPKMVALVNRVMNVRVSKSTKNAMEVEYAINTTSLTESEVEVLKESFPTIMESVRGYFVAILNLKAVRFPEITYYIQSDFDGLPVAHFRIKYQERRQFKLSYKMLIANGIAFSLTLSFVISTNLISKFFYYWIPLSLTISLSIVLWEYLKLRKFARETERSLERLDQQYIALHSTNLVVEEQLRESKLLNEVSNAFLTQGTEESILHMACNSLIENIGLDRVVVLMLDKEKQSLIFKVSAGDSAEKLKLLLDGFSLSLSKDHVSENAISAVFRSGKPILIPEVKKYLAELTEERSKNLLNLSGSKAFIAAPIRTATKGIGVILADTIFPDKPLNSKKLKLLTTVANQMAIFIEKQNAQHSLIEAYQSEMRLAESYSRFVPMETLEMLKYNSVQDVKIGDGTEHKLTTFFCDIREFTSLCEDMSPNEVLKFLNSFYGRLSPIIKTNKGIIDKFIGDGMMALFASFGDAVTAAIEVQRALVCYNLDRRVGGRKVLEIGIGLAKGNVIFGPLGFEGRVQLTALSDSVNLASRLDSLCPSYDARILITGAEIEEIPEINSLSFQIHPDVAVKGKKSHVRVIELIDRDLLKDLRSVYNASSQIKYIETLESQLTNKVEKSLSLKNHSIKKVS